MDQAGIIAYIAQTFPNIDIVQPQPGQAPDLAVGDTFFIYNPEQRPEPHYQFPFATLVTKDYGEFDNASNLNRPGVYRLNLNVSRETYQSLFGPHPAAPPEGGPVPTGHDFAVLDHLIPHPIYAPQSWVSVLNPSDLTFETVKPLLAEAYQQTVRRYERKQN